MEKEDCNYKHENLFMNITYRVSLYLWDSLFVNSVQKLGKPWIIGSSKKYRNRILDIYIKHNVWLMYPKRQKSDVTVKRSWDDKRYTF